MNPLIVKVIIVVVIVAGGSVSGYAAVKYYTTSQPPALQSFIPQDSMAVVHYVNDTVNVYGFVANDSVAAIQTESMSSFFAYLNSTAQNVTHNPSAGVSITSVGLFDGYQIFKVELGTVNLFNMTVSSFIGSQYSGGIPTSISGINIGSNLSSYQNAYLNKSALYVSPITTSATLLGDSPAVYAGISASSSGNSFNYNRYIDPNANISLYINLTTTNISTTYGVNYLTANVTLSATTITANATLTFTNSTARSKVDTVLNLFLGLASTYLANNSITINLNDVGSTVLVVSLSAPLSITQNLTTPASLPKS